MLGCCYTSGITYYGMLYFIILLLQGWKSSSFYWRLSRVLGGFFKVLVVSRNRIRVWRLQTCCKEGFTVKNRPALLTLKYGSSRTQEYAEVSGLRGDQQGHDFHRLLAGSQWPDQWLAVLYHHASGDKLPLPQEHGLGDQSIAAVPGLHSHGRPRHYVRLGTWNVRRLAAGHHRPGHLHPQGHGLWPNDLGILHHFISLQWMARVHTAATRKKAAFQHLLQAHQLCPIYRNRLLHHGHCIDVWHAGDALRRGSLHRHEGTCCHCS